MRLFTAIELPDEVRACLVQVQDVLLQHRLLKEGVSWTAPHNLHLTLKFFGEVAEPDVPGLTKALALARFDPMRLIPDHLASFPPKGPLRVISVGLKGDAPLLATLFDQIETACAPCGIPREARRYTAHITLARVRRQSQQVTSMALADVLKGLPLPGPAFQPAEFVLMDSQLDSKGSIYTVVARYGISSPEH